MMLITLLPCKIIWDNKMFFCLLSNMNLTTILEAKMLVLFYIIGN